ncbi:DUF4153 domain-containing protein [Flavobacterium sp. WLB]|uniref:DUF4153 domain-containing protein n=1 Tax=unclassified Flavobacterium TaxID=196869 RepID=UPI0006AB9617|nr:MULTISPECIES: DUF4153 domain-containing protein [unclassified Flavobacterium]KOP40236.1 hypothetical protein AKO67_00960 [Flavobacterium sp. VMW]OWU91376.1 hypothetical protein APR43_07920 [Flavobacterium sp. NLM]PUU71130.1 DUF4153 domain-containing protein [Flavobacterium sp. WLB]
MSKLPSLQNVLNATLKTVLRFPLETITAILGTVFAILFIRQDRVYDDEFYIKAIMSCSLCLVWFVSASLFFAAKHKNGIIRFVVSLLFSVPLVAFVFNFGERISEVEAQQFFVFSLALHLLVSFAGFLPRTYNQEEFWEFNKQLFLRILTSGLYSIVLYTGLALAILAVDKLFKVKLDDKIYGYLFFTIAGIFNTIFFLSGVPETNSKEYPLLLSYPKGLKNFTQFVLLPLISIYLVILICYEAKILITLSLPVGWVSYLVLAFAIVGILSFLLVHPIANENGNLWMRTFNRWFYFLLIPLLALLFWAILYRINLYGFTHERYYVFLLSIWLTIVVGYFLISKHPKIKFIPISMCLAGLLSIVGPQSANSVSKYSQLSRFESYLQKAENKKLTFEQEKELSSIVDFLDRNYTLEDMLPYADKKLYALYKKDKDPGSYKIMESLGYEYRSIYDRKNDADDIFNYYFYEDTDEIVDIHGYDFIIVLYKNSPYECKSCLTIDKTIYSIKSKARDYGQDLIINQDIIPLKINDFINSSSGFTNNNSDKKIEQRIENSKYTILLTYLSASGGVENNKKIPENYQIKVMVGIKK